ncbi:MAG TPA: hypothetical protein VE645_19155 [Pseudonocardiaceae bacterium]|jgi:hypothetical protein|nr:hypothetical protein [Pseudonocardiaceae bacterium]
MPITDDGTKQEEDDEDMGDWGPAVWQQMKDDIEWLKSLIVPAVTAKGEDRGPPWILIMTGCLTPIIVALLTTQPWN